MIPLDKVQVKAYISRDLNSVLRQFLGETHGLKRSILSRFIERAINTQLKIENKQQQNSQNLQIADKSKDQQDIVNTRILMQEITRECFKADHPLDRGAQIRWEDLVQLIIKVKDLSDNRKDRRTPNKWIRKLEEREFIHKLRYDIFEVLDTGADWAEISTETEQVTQEQLT